MKRGRFPTLKPLNENKIYEPWGNGLLKLSASIIKRKRESRPAQ